MVTIKDIAALAGVSKTTVSKVLNNKDEKISNATRQKVLDIVKQKNYIPNKMAQSLVTKKTKTIGVIIPDIRNPFFTDIVRGIEDKAFKEGYNIILCNTDECEEKEVKAINTLIEKMVDGIIFAPSSKGDSNLSDYNGLTKPIVLVDKKLNIKNLKGIVTLDNKEGTYLATNLLVENNHKKILYLSGPLKNKISKDRLKGYKKALKKAGIKYDESLVLKGEYSLEWGYEIIKKLKYINFTAICAGNDLIAIGAIKALKERNIRVPKDVSVVGFDDIETSSIINPQLTTIKQNSYSMGYESANILIKNLEKKSFNNIEKITFKPELIIRDSTAKKVYRRLTMKKICVVGSLNMDLVVNVETMPKKGQTLIGGDFKEVPGGKGANQAVAMARLGADVSMIGKVGTDGFGQTLLEALKNDNVNTSYIYKEEGPSGVATITVDKNAENSIVVAPGANFALGKEDIDKNIEAIKSSDIVVVQLETPLETINYTLKKAKELGKYTILNPAPAVNLDDSIIKNVDLLTPNETELEILSGVSINCEDDILKASKIMIEKGVKELIVTLGSKGSLYINKEKNMFKKSYKVEAIDTTAAGDSYTGALAVAFSKGKNIEEAMDFASKVGALCVTKEGAQSSLPTIDEVEKFRG